MKDTAQGAAGPVRELSLNDVCTEILEGTRGVIGCAVIDIESGLVLGVAHNIPNLSDTYVEAIAAAAVDLFRGKTIQAVEELISAHYGTAVENSIQELQVTTNESFNFMATVPGKPNTLFVLSTERTIKLGLGWTLVRANSQKIAPICP